MVSQSTNPILGLPVSILAIVASLEGSHLPQAGSQAFFSKFLFDPFPMPQPGTHVLSQGWKGVYLKGPVGLPSRAGRVERVNIRACIFPSGYLDHGGERTPVGTHPLPPPCEIQSVRDGEVASVGKRWRKTRAGELGKGTGLTHFLLRCSQDRARRVGWDWCFLKICWGHEDTHRVLYSLPYNRNFPSSLTDLDPFLGLPAEARVAFSTRHM